MRPLPTSRAATVPALLALLLAGAPAVALGGVAVEGRDRARILPPSGARVGDYANAGYTQVVRGGEVLVEVELAPLGSSAPFEPPRRPAAEAIARVARAQTSGAATRLEAVSRILAWVSRHVDYRLERRESQEAAAVLERRSAYCTGVARLTVALLESVGIEAREVVGYVVDHQPGKRERGYHRWIEVYFPGAGWVFSDPLASHHFVPATYVRLASDQVDVGRGMDGLLLERLDRIVTVDVHRGSAPSVRARRNSERRWAAALNVRVSGVRVAGDGEPGEVMLRGASALYRHSLAGGEATFVGLEPGSYQLYVNVPGRGELWQAVELPDRRADSLTIRLGSPSAVRGRTEEMGR